MGRQAPHVYTDPADIRRLELLVDVLPANGHVRFLLKDGSHCEGVVSARPNVQVFRDPDTREGINGEVQLEQPGTSAWTRRFWLDEIERVEHLDSTLGSES
jgi:uncharacterized protein DUF3247